MAVSGVCLGVPEENSGKVPGKLPEKICPGSRNATNSGILGHRERQTCRAPWVDTAWTLSPPSVRGVFWNRQFQPSRSFLNCAQNNFDLLCGPLLEAATAVSVSATKNDFQNRFLPRVCQPCGFQTVVRDCQLNRWGLKGCLAAHPGNRPFFCPFRPFSALFRRVQRAPEKSSKRRKKTFFLRYPQICLSPHLLNPHFWRHSRFAWVDFSMDASCQPIPPNKGPTWTSFEGGALPFQTIGQAPQKTRQALLSAPKLLLD